MPLARTAWSRTCIRACSTEDHRLNRLFPHYVGQSNPQEVRTHNDDQKTGGEIVRKAISRPARQIAIKAGEDGSIVVGTILEKDAYAYGYDAQAGEYGNLISKGIIDPTKLVRTALQDAASIAGRFITTM